MTITAPTELNYTPPNRSTQSPETFSSNSNDTVTQLKTFSTEMITAVSQLNTDIGNVNTNAADIISAANSAVASANFQGDWADLTGAFTEGYSVKHDGLLWIANTAIADVTASEPGVSGDWDQIGGIVRETRTANIELVAIDFGKIIDYTSGTFSQTFSAAATLGEGWGVTLANNGSGVITLDPDASETINGSATIELLPGQVAFVTGNGTALFFTLVSGNNNITREVRTSSTIFSTSDNGKIIDYTTGSFTQTFGAAATLGAGWNVILRNMSSNDVTLDPDGSETIDEATSGPIKPGMAIKVVCDGSNFHAYRIGPQTTIEVLTSGTSWTCPVGVRYPKLTMVGGGGGGGGSTSGNASGGGGSGALIKASLPVTPGSSYTYSIGAAGTGGSAGAQGTPGGNSTFQIDGSNTLTSGGGAQGEVALPGTGGTATGAGSVVELASQGGDGHPGSSGDTPDAPPRGGASYFGQTYGAGGIGALNASAGLDGTQGVILLEY